MLTQPGILTQQRPAPAMNPIDRLAADDFAPYLGRAFRAEGGGPELVLTALDRAAYRGWERAARPPFSLILRGPADPVLQEGLHRLTIEDGPTLTLYVIPIVNAARGHQDYQVVFN